MVSLFAQAERLQAKLTADPTSLVFAQLADAHRKGGRHDEAIRVCREGLRHHPNYASAHFVLGRAYQEKSNLPAAREAFQRVLELDPENVLAQRFLGEIAEACGEVSEALDAYRAALTLHPFDKEIREAVGRLEALRGDEVGSVPAEAPEAYQAPTPPEIEALRSEQLASAPPEVPLEDREPGASEPEPVATETLGDLYAEQGHYDRAAEIYKQVVEEVPEREELKQKHEEVLTHLETTVEREEVAPQGEEVVPFLEAWRDAFRRLKGGRVDPLRLLEAWRSTFRKLKAETVEPEPLPLLEGWRDVFRRLKVDQGETS
ncbi:MAG: tetratricopeptide repeat protein [Candidatus Methylomirabilales bacterium]